MNDPLEKSNPTQAEYFKDIVGTIREPLLVLDASLRVLAANRSFYKFFKVKAGETIGKLVYDLGDRQWNIPGLRLLLETILPQKAVFNDYEVERDFPGIGRRVMFLNARRIPKPPKKLQWILLAFEDVTERMELQRSLQASEKQFHAVFDTASDSMLLVDKISGQVRNSNRAAQDSLGYSKRAVQKKNLWELGILKDRRQFRRISIELEKQGVVGLVDTTIPTSQGGDYPADITIMDRSEVIQCNIHGITELKQAEDKLKEERFLLRTLIDNLPDRIYIMDAQGRKLLSNQADWQASGGKTMEDVIGKTDFDLYPADLAKDYWAIDKEVIDSGKTILNMEEPGLDSHGNPVTVLTSKVPLTNQNGKIVGLVGIGRNITERKQAEEALRESEIRITEALEFNRKILYTSSIGILTYKESGQCVSANAAAAKVTGGTLAQLLAQNFHEIPSWKKSGMYQVAIRALDTGVEQLLEVHFLTTFGKDGWLSFSFTPFDSAGERHLLVFASDITERKQAEEAVRASETRYRGLFENSPVALWEEDFSSVKRHIEKLKQSGVTDLRKFLEGHPQELLAIVNKVKVLDVNQAAMAMVRATHKEQLLGNLGQVIPFEAGKEFMEELVNIAEGRTEFAWEGINYTLDGEKLLVSLHWSVAPGHADTLKKVLVSLLNITERKQAEAKVKEYSEHLEEMVAERTSELREAQEQLVRKEKLAVLGQLAGGVGHELRNPLGVISNSVYYLKMVQPDANEKIKKHHDMIEQELHNATRIVGDLLDYAREISTEPQPASVTELVEHTLSRFPVPASISVKINIPDRLPQVFADPLHVEQVLGNLVTNACQAMSSQSLDLKAGSAPVIAGGKLSIKARQTNNMLAIAVKDTGPGISPENMQKLFEPLFTTKARGIGLGLAVSRKLAEANGGRIEVESQVGQGSTFTLYLPIRT